MPALKTTLGQSVLMCTCMCTSSVAVAAPHGERTGIAPRSGGHTLTTDLLAKRLARARRLLMRLRGLRPPRRMKTAIVTTARMRALLLQQIQRDLSATEIEASSQVLARLGLLQPNKPYLAQVLQRLGSAVAGFYDPHSKTLVVAQDQLGPTLDATLLHELCHAGQDRAYHLARFMRGRRGDSDRLLARQGLVEGDCTALLVEAAYLRQGIGIGALGGSFRAVRRTLLGKAPTDFLGRLLRFPYAAGLSFVQKLRRRHDVWMMGRIFRRPPRTTEQLLHYRKYWRRESAHRIRVAKLRALKTATAIHDDRIGEATVEAYLAHHVGAAIASRAAEGWGGARLVAYRLGPGDKLPAIVLQTSWDSAADAREFENAQLRVFRARGLQRARAGGASSVAVFRDAQKLQWSIQRYRDAVLVLMAFDPTSRLALQKEVWARWTIRGRRRVPPR